MPEESFEKLFPKLRPYIQKNKGFRDSISAEKQVAAALYYPADEGRMRKVANSFLVSGNRVFPKLSDFFCFFTLENFSIKQPELPKTNKRHPLSKLIPNKKPQSQ